MEIESILSEETLKRKFNKIDSKLKNKELRQFREFPIEQSNTIPRLKDPELFREDLLKHYLMLHRDEFRDLMKEFADGKKKLDGIAAEASRQATEWQEVINIFNRRFSVPFKVGIENKQDVILKRATPNISFAFVDDSAEPVAVERERLLGRS